MASLVATTPLAGDLDYSVGCDGISVWTETAWGVFSAVKDWRDNASALPFSVVIISMVIGLVKLLRTHEEVGPQYLGSGIPVHRTVDEAGPGEQSALGNGLTKG